MMCILVKVFLVAYCTRSQYSDNVHVCLQEAQQGYRSSVVAESNDPEAVRKRAMENPEVQQILADPAMRLILEQMQKDPNALKE